MISVSDVRTAGGFPSDLISDSEIQHCLKVVEKYVEKSLNTSFEPKVRLDFLDGTNQEFFYCDKNPVLRVDALISNEVEVDVSKIFVHRESGRIDLTRENNISRFFGSHNGIRVQYWSAYLVSDDEQYLVSDDASKGENVEVVLNTANDLSVDDWVEIKNTDVSTSAKIVNISGSTITLDRLQYDVKLGSILTKLIIPEFIKRFVELEAVIYLSLNAIGATYVFNASYSLGDLNVTKGVPYTHWRESLEKAIKERETLRKIVKPRIKIV